MGLLDAAQQPMPPEAAPAPAAQNPAPQSPMVDVQAAQGDMKQKMDSMKRMVLACQKVIYTPPSSEKFLKYINPDDLPQSVGEVAALAITAIIDQGKMEGAPPDMVMPAGVTLVGDLLDYAKESFGVEVDDALTQEAIKAFLTAMVRGVQGAQALGQTGQSAPPEAAPQPPAAPPAAPQPQPQGGMV